MAVKIRLKRMGSKKNPFYRVVVADSRRARNGRNIEELGYYHPLTEEKTFKIDNERALYWIKNGAQPTATVEKLFKKNHVYETKVEQDLVAEEVVEETAEEEVVEEAPEEEVIEEAPEEVPEEVVEEISVTEEETEESAE